MILRGIQLLSLILCQALCSDAFVAHPVLSRNRNRASAIDFTSTLASSKEETPVNELSEERKASLFQFMLRDLQVEGVPLLECDAANPNILQAAMWTTMAELSDKQEADKACMIFESLPIDVLSTFVEDFKEIKTNDRLLDGLPELQRFNVSLVGKGIGPAILVETSERSDEENERRTSIIENTAAPDELKWIAAMKSFVSRVIIGNDVCPHTKENSVAPSGLESDGVQPGPLGYRLSGSQDVCDTLSAFWNCVCELLVVPDETLSSTILCFPPPVANIPDFEVETRFSAVSELISRSLCLYRGDDVFELLHMHPTYRRQSIYPEEKAAHGHLPPTGWLRPILRQNGNVDEVENLTDDQLKLQDYQRKSPLPAVVIKRASQVNTARTPADNAAEIDLEDGNTETVGDIATYSRNVIRMANEGQEALQKALEAEIALTT